MGAGNSPHFFMPRPFNPEKHFAEAKKYRTRTEFAKGSSGSYDLLWRKGLLDQACAHMPISPVYVAPKWTHEAIFCEAAKYSTRAEFKRKCSGGHGYALKHGILAQACSHMRDGHNFWHILELMAVAIKYQYQSDFIREQKSAYEFCKKQNLIDIVCANMERRIKWGEKADVLAEAAKHQSRGAFQAAASGAFKRAYDGGYLDEACAHMPPPAYGFQKEKPSILYFLRVGVPGVGDLFKVGITNRDPLSRVAGMGAYPGVSIEVIETISFDNGRDARIAEKRLHRKFSKHRYTGAPVMKNGNTELFTVNVLDT